MKGPHLPIQLAHLPKDYAGLCGLLMPRPIRDKVDLENVTGMTDALAGHKLTADQEDYFDLLCRLVEDYESEQGGVSAPRVTGLAALRHLLDEHGMSGADLSRLLGAHRTLGSMILRGERKLTVEHVRTLCAHFGVSGDLFL